MVHDGGGHAVHRQADRLQATQRVSPAHCRCDVQGTCALNAEHIIKLLTFDAIDKNKAAGSDVTEISARLADLVKVCAWLRSQRYLIILPCHIGLFSAAC